MADWESYKGKFRDNIEGRKAETLRATQKQTLVSDKQRTLWKSLRDEIITATRVVNGSDSILANDERDNFGVTEFEIVHLSTQHSCIVKFNPKEHTVTIHFKVARQISDVGLNIRANDDGDVFFDLSNRGGGRSIERIVSWILDALL